MQEKLHTLAILIFALSAPTPLAHAIVYGVTPYDVGAPGGVEVVGGMFTTDDTIGTALALGAILTD